MTKIPVVGHMTFPLNGKTYVLPVNGVFVFDREQIEVAGPQELDGYGLFVGLQREHGEPDSSYRPKLLARFFPLG